MLNRLPGLSYRPAHPIHASIVRSALRQGLRVAGRRSLRIHRGRSSGREPFLPFVDSGPAFQNVRMGLPGSGSGRKGTISARRASTSRRWYSRTRKTVYGFPAARLSKSRPSIVFERGVFGWPSIRHSSLPSASFQKELQGSESPRSLGLEVRW